MFQGSWTRFDWVVMLGFVTTLTFAEHAKTEERMNDGELAAKIESAASEDLVAKVKTSSFGLSAEGEKTTEDLVQAAINAKSEVGKNSFFTLFGLGHLNKDEFFSHDNYQKYHDAMLKFYKGDQSKANEAILTDLSAAFGDKTLRGMLKPSAGGDSHVSELYVGLLQHWGLNKKSPVEVAQELDLTHVNALTSDMLTDWKIYAEQYVKGTNDNMYDLLVKVLVEEGVKLNDLNLFFDKSNNIMGVETAEFQKALQNYVYKISKSDLVQAAIADKSEVGKNSFFMHFGLGHHNKGEFFSHDNYQKYHDAVLGYYNGDESKANEAILNVLTKTIDDKKLGGMLKSSAGGDSHVSELYIGLLQHWGLNKKSPVEVVKELDLTHVNALTSDMLTDWKIYAEQYVKGTNDNMYDLLVKVLVEEGVKLNDLNLFFDKSNNIMGVETAEFQKALQNYVDEISKSDKSIDTARVNNEPIKHSLRN